MDEIKEIREALELALREHNELMGSADLPVGSKKIEGALVVLARLEAREAELTKDRDYWKALAMQFHDAVHAEVDRRNAEIERRAKVEI